MEGYLLISAESEARVAGPFLKQKPCRAQDCAVIYPEQSAVSGSLPFSALCASTSQARPFVEKLEEINTCLDTETLVGYRHREHNARVTEVFSCNGVCLRPGAATAVVEDVAERSASVTVILGHQ